MSDSEGRTEKWIPIAIVAVLLLLLGGAWWAKAGSSEDPQESALTPAEINELLGPVKVVYEVTGDATDGASVTVQTPSGSEQMDVSLPLTNRAGGRGLHLEFPRGAFVYISAQNRGEYGSVTCTIKVDGEVISENTSTADYGIATCKGRS